MGILMKELIRGKYYWVTDLTNTVEFKVQKLLHFNTIRHPMEAGKSRDYKYTCIFGSIEDMYEVDLYDTDTKFGMMLIDNHIVTDNMSKMLEVLNNHVVRDYNKNHQENVLDYKQIEDYISDIRSNYPELLI